MLRSFNSREPFTWFYFPQFKLFILIFDAATDDTQRMMQMSGFGMDPSKVKFFKATCL